jgi:hypothetical protein
LGLDQNVLRGERDRTRVHSGVVRDHLRRVPLGWQTVAPDQDTCNHVWILDKTSEVVRLICAKCGKVMNP